MTLNKNHTIHFSMILNTQRFNKIKVAIKKSQSKMHCNGIFKRGNVIRTTLLEFQIQQHRLGFGF